jgi:hypothetical protein
VLADACLAKGRSRPTQFQAASAVAMVLVRVVWQPSGEKDSYIFLKLYQASTRMIITNGLQNRDTIVNFLSDP